MDEKEIGVLRSMADTLQNQASQIAALRLFCGYLLAQHAATTPDPKNYMSNLAAEFLGFAESIADVSSSAFSECVEGVVASAEKSLVARSAKT